MICFCKNCRPKLVANQGLIRKILNRMGRTGIDVQFEWVEAHKDDYGNNRADLLAKKIAYKQR